MGVQVTLILPVAVTPLIPAVIQIVIQKNKYKNQKSPANKWLKTPPTSIQKG